MLKISLSVAFSPTEIFGRVNVRLDFCGRKSTENDGKKEVAPFSTPIPCFPELFLMHKADIRISKTLHLCLQHLVWPLEKAIEEKAMFNYRGPITEIIILGKQCNIVVLLPCELHYFMSGL